MQNLPIKINQLCKAIVKPTIIHFVLVKFKNTNTQKPTCFLQLGASAAAASSVAAAAR